MPKNTCSNAVLIRMRFNNSKLRSIFIMRTVFDYKDNHHALWQVFNSEIYYNGQKMKGGKFETDEKAIDYIKWRFNLKNNII